MTSFSVSATRLTGSELLEAVRLMTDKVTRSEMCQICGYYTEEGNNTKLHFTDFYMAILDAKKDVIVDDEESEIIAENDVNQEAIDEALEDYPADAVRAFIEYFGEDCISDISDSYQGEMSGAEFAEQLVTDCYSLDIPSFVSIDWEDTWDNLRHDYAEQDGFIFCTNF
jgi:transcription elongation factor Elf1